MPIKPAGSGRSTSSSPTSGIAPTPWLKWYDNPLSLHGKMWGPPSLPVPWFLAFIISLSFFCTPPEKKTTNQRKKTKKTNKNICSRIEVDIWNSPIAHWCCGWGKLLSFSGAAAATQGQLWDMILNCSCSQSWARLALQLYAWTGFLAISTMCGSPPHMPLRAATVGDNAALWEMMQHCGRCWGWPPAGSGLVIITTTTSDVHRRDRNSDFCLFTFLWPWFLCSYGKKKPKFPSLSSCTSSTCLQCPFLFVAGTVIGETSGFTVNF